MHDLPTLFLFYQMKISILHRVCLSSCQKKYLSSWTIIYASAWIWIIFCFDQVDNVSNVEFFFSLKLIRSLKSSRLKIFPLWGPLGINIMNIIVICHWKIVSITERRFQLLLDPSFSDKKQCHHDWWVKFKNQPFCVFLCVFLPFVSFLSISTR